MSSETPEPQDVLRIVTDVMGGYTLYVWGKRGRSLCLSVDNDRNQASCVEANMDGGRFAAFDPRDRADVQRFLRRALAVLEDDEDAL